jgi:adenosylcobinamide-phosphate synthase
LPESLALVALVALALDAVLGWPGALYRRIGHPVGAFARLIGQCERSWNRPDLVDGQRRALGVLTVALLVMTAGGGAYLVEAAARHFAGPLAWLAIALAAWPALAQRSLHDHVVPVLRALEAGDLPAARKCVGMIVGRDTGSLDGAGVARAGIESLAESFCDGIVAPLFWLMVLGLPGLWIYKAINTADSMIGHPEEPMRAFGWAAARSDDALNLIPARLSGLAICLAGPGGWRVLWRDHGKHASPNAGWPEAAMAGVLGVRLAGPVRYEGQLHDKAWIGQGGDASVAAMRGARIVFVRACGLLWLIAGGMAWLV